MKASALKPGKVLAYRFRRDEYNHTTGHFERSERVHLAMLIGFKTDVKRRHAKSAAKTDFYHVIVLWMTDERNPRLETLRIDLKPPSWGARWEVLF